jgi:Protein of unknown function (DUF4012)
VTETDPNSSLRRSPTAGTSDQRVALAIARRSCSASRGLLLAGGLLLVLVLAAGFRTWTAYAAHRTVAEDVGALRTVTSGDLGTISSTGLTTIESQIDDLDQDLRLLDASTSIPLGGEAVVGALPWIGPRYTSGRQVIQLAQFLTDLGDPALRIGREALSAFEATGASSPSPPASPTWLDVLSEHQAELEQIGRQLDRAQALRAEIDANVLPAALQDRLTSLDQVLNHVDGGTLDTDLPALFAALGADHPVRYLVLFQNRVELRLSGGFPGMIALITLDRGQLRSDEFSDIYDLAGALTNSDVFSPCPAPASGRDLVDGFHAVRRPDDGHVR